MTLHYQDQTTTLHLGDALDVVATMPGASVDCIVTSPPYFGLRDYNADGQYGHEKTVHEYVQTILALFRECRRVLANDGTLWLNLGDCYRDKQLLGVPWRVALALQDDGWLLRNDIVWHKPNAMPQSVTDRLSERNEHIFMFAKQKKYWFDLKPIRVTPTTDYQGKTWSSRRELDVNSGGHGRGMSAGKQGDYDGLFASHPDGKNPGDMWNVNTKPFKGAHFAAFPPEIPRRAILAGCKPGGTVLDPFSGSATTGMVAIELGRQYIGIDINPCYHDLALSTRLKRDTLKLFGEAA